MRHQLFSSVLLLSTAIILLFTPCTGSSAVQWASAGQNGPDDVCNGKGQEERVLCEASQMKEASIRQVIEEDETTQIEEDPKQRSADDVWTAAYNQWIASEAAAQEHNNPKAVNRAIEEARKRYGDQSNSVSSENMSSTSLEMPDLDNDELEQITAAVNRIKKDSIEISEAKEALDIIDTLCSSGDNGRQVEAAGGLPFLLQLGRHQEHQVALMAVRAFASCCQNNPKVFESAVNVHGAVDKLISISLTNVNRLDMLAATLRAVVAIGEANGAKELFVTKEENMVSIAKSSLAANWQDREGKRCVIRGYALIEQRLQTDEKHWKGVFVNAGVIEMAESALGYDNIDIREGAARVLALVR